MSKEGKILIVDDDEDILTAGKLLLRRHFAQVMTCNRPDFIPQIMAEHTFDAILLDMNFGPGESSGEQGFTWLARVLEIDPDAVVVMITAHGGVNVAVEAMKIGATDFIAKPWQNEKVVATLNACVKLGRSRTEAASLKATNAGLAAASNPVKTNAIIGSSVPMQDVHTMIDRAGPTDANVMILGENGTGKELIARALHKASTRANAVFMAVDMGSLSESLFESELFGHKKGAFTDAREDRIGRFQAANGGTLFLDEIGNLPKHLQAKLLTVLEQRRITPLGSNEIIPIDVRIITATNMPRDQIAKEETFRQDLLFRMNTVEITLPPLRDRADDILPISQHYIAHYARKYNRPIKALSPAAESAITHYPWPGNVRALRHAIERALILSEEDMLTPADFQLESQTEETEASSETESSSFSAGEDLNLERLEKKVIETALRKHRYNISHAAKELGLTRAALYRRMEKHGL